LIYGLSIIDIADELAVSLKTVDAFKP